jgi:hypothetical protein
MAWSRICGCMLDNWLNNIRYLHDTRGAMLPAQCVQKLSTQMNVELVGDQEVCGRHTDGIAS